MRDLFVYGCMCWSCFRMCCGSLIVWMCIRSLYNYREFVIGVRCYAYAYLLYGMIVVSRSWSGVTNGVDVRWVCVGVWLAGYRKFDE